MGTTECLQRTLYVLNKAADPRSKIRRIAAAIDVYYVDSHR